MRAENENRKYLSDIISETDIAIWDEKNILIDSSTGTGKTTFILNVLYYYAKTRNRNILILEPRTDLVKDLKSKVDEHDKADIIKIDTFQKIESSNYDLSRYYYIVIDECHYFLHDSGLNPNSEISYLKLLEVKATKIYMSGTATRIKKYMQRYDNVEFLEYHLKTNSAVSSIWFYDKSESLDWLVATALQNGYKGILFTTDLKKGAELHRKYKDQTIFCCSQDNDDYKKYRNDAEIAEMLRTGTLGDKSLLIASTTLDVGISIRDKEITTIIIDNIDDLSTIVQCVGRKRQIDDNDKAAVYIQNTNNMQIGGRLQKLEQARKKALNFLDGNEEKYIKAYRRNEADESRILYHDWSAEKKTSERFVNQVRLFNVECQIEDYKRMLDQKPDGFRKVLTAEFGQSEFSKLDDNKELALVTYLESLVKSGEKFLDKKAHDKLATTLNVNINGRPCKTISTINSALQKDLHLPYEIVSKPTDRIVNGRKKRYKSAWRVVKI